VAVAIHTVGEEHLDELLVLMRAYCDFYEAAPPDDRLLELSRALIADPAHEGVQLLARDESDPSRPAVGFATVFWTWSTLSASRLAVMNDLFVAETARGQGTAEALIEACRARAARHGATALEWQTAKDNLRAQAVYDRVGGVRGEWLDYSLAVWG
jgi:GNAT superfamily N-acetyltransferase